MQFLPVDPGPRRGVAWARILAVCAIVLLPACEDDPDALLLEVSADDNAARLRVEVKGPSAIPAQTVEFDVDPTGSGRDLSKPEDAYALALRFPSSGRYAVHIVDVSGVPPRQAFSSSYQISGLTRGKAHLVRFVAGDDDDGDGWSETCPADQPDCLVDCNDGDRGSNPFATDVCEDGADQDCDGEDRACADADADGFPERCGPDAPAGCQADCNDTDAEVNPGELESSTTCNGVTERRCDDGIDQDCRDGDAVCHTDADCDGHYPLSEPGGTDCADDDPDRHPGVNELCDDNVDQDCDGTPDDGCARCDEDGDGEFGQHPERGCEVAPEQRDCDDSDRAVHHGATADCDGNEGAPACAARGFCGVPAVDEDCDGTANEGCVRADCDADEDGYARADCPTRPSAGAADCNDGDPNIHPGAPEKCGDGIAQNCNFDANCTAVDVDDDGYEASQDCDDRDGDVHPAAVEACNGVDDDCDGVVDEGNPTVGGGASLDGATCTFDDDGLCGSGPPGRCVCSPTASDGVLDATGDRQLCPGEAAGPFGARCFGAVQPVQERCDQLDQDCDERNDDPTGANLDPAELGQPCHDLPAPCVAGMVVGCDNSQTTPYFTNVHWVCSADQRGPENETCNGVDDNCSGVVDEGFGLGMTCDGPDGDQCREGVLQCSVAGGSECNDNTATNVELCNNVDDDCDGVNNEGFANLGQACDGGDTDQCNEGVFVCNGAGDGTVCNDPTGDNDVERCNNADDDCDGATDEDFPDKGQICDGSDTDQCPEGTQVCRGDGTGTQCNDPAGDNDVERCNDADDDCDGATDEDFPTLGMSCDGNDGDMCLEGIVVCQNNVAVCTDGTGTTSETCNSNDDDCDGSTDENTGGTCGPLGDSCNGGTCGCGSGPLCTSTTANNCTAGTCRCGSNPACSTKSSNNCTGGNCRCGTAPACSGLSDTCTANICRCGSGAACTAATADACSGGACTCGGGPACSTKNSNSCTQGDCRCGAAPACSGLSDTCTGGACLCGALPACDATLADACSDGACTCGGGPACTVGQMCTGGVCL